MDSVKSQIDMLMKVSYSATCTFDIRVDLHLSQTASEIQKKVDQLVLPIPTSDAATPG